MKHEERQTSRLRRGRSLRFQVIVAALICAAVAESGAGACSCTCYFSTDCSSGSYCNYSGCTHTTVGGKLRDGLCKGSGGGVGGGFFLPEAWLTAGDTLDLWLQAYEVAGFGGFFSASTLGEGQPPDPDLVAMAQALPLDSDQHEFIRQLAISIQVAYVGLSLHPDELPHRPGFFIAPDVDSAASCSTPYAAEDHGRILSLNPTLLGVAELIREASVNEIKNPGQGIFEETMARIPAEFPDYQTFGRCEYPHPPEHGHDFPYADGVSCLTRELSGAIKAVTLSRDCNSNGVPDSIDVTTGGSEDVNDNGEPDECEIGRFSCIFSGVAQGGEVSVTLSGFSDTCTVSVMTVPGETAVTVVENLVAAINADACMGSQEITATASGGQILMSGFLLKHISTDLTDAGLRHDIPVVVIPTLTPYGLAQLVALLLLSGALIILRRGR